ncbi:hypothetical protein DD238_002995 [Peronospora effusa]|uniref:FYVE-type domain-containing protein n=1 Tax=Peronospora effusa TaxID=542832 RepID=A0A3M6VKX5_9STRA|nr:hypothetical protein DD238_002995 [Peronospora effusa]RQM15197.1 hypothetical protein DD237_002691 [Peronospora effusa]
MVGVFMTERERLDLVQQGDNIFLEVQERFYEAKAQNALPEKDKIVTSLETFTVYGSLDAVTDLYLKYELKMVLDFSESRELAVLKLNTKQRPLTRTSLRWSLLYSPSHLLGKDQDFCYLEVMKPFGTTDGRRGWARCSHSIEHKLCPVLQNAQGIDVNRAELFYCGLFFEETDQLGVLNATMYYNIKGYHATSLLIPRVLKAQSKRTIELVNHYLKMSAMMLKSRNVSLTKALQLQAERRCGACANHISIWKRKERCVLCGSLMCDKCNDIASRNYKVDRIPRGQVICFSCAHRRGKKIVLETETGYNDLDASGETYSIMTTHHKSGLRSENILSLSGEDYPTWFYDEGKTSLGLDQKNQLPQQPKPSQEKMLHQNLTSARNSEFLPYETIYLPTDDAEHQRRRCNTSASTRLPSNRVDNDVVARRRRQTTGISRQLARVESRSSVPPRQKSCPKYGGQANTGNENFTPVGTPLGSQVDLDLEELNWRMRRYTTNSVPVQPMELTDRGRHLQTSTCSHTIVGKRHHDRHRQSNQVSQRPLAPVILPTRTSIRYSKANPCDLSYLASFKLTAEQNKTT